MWVTGRVAKPGSYVPRVLGYYGEVQMQADGVLASHYFSSKLFQYVILAVGMFPL